VIKISRREYLLGATALLTAGKAKAQVSVVAFDPVAFARDICLCYKDEACDGRSPLDHLSPAAVQILIGVTFPSSLPYGGKTPASPQEQRVAATQILRERSNKKNLDASLKSVELYLTQFDLNYVPTALSAGIERFYDFMTKAAEFTSQCDAQHKYHDAAWIAAAAMNALNPAPAGLPVFSKPTAWGLA